ncbi:hypothetical protein J2X46_003285 [Nocardioides sp. BE266]|uniref:hypothetical protein n=1 Tax=Nocardioides sp. BE266 TaxID=2817725 RepID=UPI00285E4447|nr:hypothetical protein [Nocardioides sp. BE266]MDR7254292.1 hypothetical protein [Nocardioides sp. BE266]
MPIDPTLPVVAIFGSNFGDPAPPQEVMAAELLAAELLAAAIHRAGALVLCGAAPVDPYDDKPDTVKDRAAYTLRDSGDGERAAWIGVASSGKARAPLDHGTSGVVVTPGGRHRRNFVEACLCDAAVAIGGTSPGTASEALFSRYLRRRVALVAHQPDPARTLGDLRDRMGDRVLPKGDRQVLDRGIARALRWAEASTKHIKERALPTDDASADQIVAKLLRNLEIRQPRPDYPTLVDESTWDDYLRLALVTAIPSRTMPNRL